ncbi:MAG TPA: hypothetical protein VF373_08085 [Prolixibacteraceae bacterium]
MEDDFSVLTKKRQMHHHFDNHQFGAIETISIGKDDVIYDAEDCGHPHTCGTPCNLVSGHTHQHYCTLCRTNYS